MTSIRPDSISPNWTIFCGNVYGPVCGGGGGVIKFTPKTISKQHDITCTCICVFFILIMSYGITILDIANFHKNCVFKTTKNIITDQNFIAWYLHSLEVVSHWRDSQFQVSANYSDLTKLMWIIFKSCCSMARVTANMFKFWHLKW